MEISCKATEELPEIVLLDRGPPLHLERIRPRDLEEIRPGGLGTHFIRSVMDEVHYAHREGGGNILSMIAINMSEVTYMDSSGVASLVEGLQMARTKKRALVLFGLQQGPKRCLNRRVWTRYSRFEPLNSRRWPSNCCRLQQTTSVKAMPTCPSHVSR